MNSLTFRLFSEALRQLTDDERKMLHIKTFGSAKIVSSKGVGSAVNYVNTRDLVPLISGCIGVIRSMFDKDYDVREDDSESYEEALRIVREEGALDSCME